VKIKLNFVIVVTIILFCSISSTLLSHHIRGLPHYGYSENYPQIPTFEETRVVEHYEITFSFIRIFETNNCDLAVYIKDIITDEPYKEIITYQVFDNSDDIENTHTVEVVPDPTNTYRAGWVYDDPGIYTLQVKFKNDDLVIDEEFQFQAGDIEFNMLWIIIPSIFILSLFTAASLKRRKKIKKTKFVNN